MFIINISVFLSILGLLVILFFPVARLFILKSFIAGVLIGIMAFLIFISFTVFILFLKRFAEIYLVSSGVGSVESFKLSYKLIEKNILSIFLMWLVCVGISFALGIGMVIIIVTMGLPAIFLGVIIYGLVGNLGVIVLSVLAIALVMILIIFINTIFNVFFQTIWILFFKEIANPDNDSEEILAVPQKNNEEILANNVVEPGGVYNAKE
jgi:hypothetical protein